ncbi:Replication protein O [Paraburkholderia aspalathi]|uniref:Replication protein O n=1 Tax=Paraburkholderia aspalathi TaxID=1324617 RepID=UPI001B12705A|nr:Replication protein O [Paraburkholderia aspalathi]CAE6846863.1 hypothetical protein R20943_07379 [Paraburkholderia aspalathi]
MFIAQHSVASEGSVRPLLAESSCAATDGDALVEFTSDSINLPWIIFRAVHRATHIQGLSTRSRALLAALARTVDADRPYAAIFARRELLTGRAMQSMRTFYRSLDDLEAAGLITRAPQKRYGSAGLFGRAYLHLTEKAAKILGLVATEQDAVEMKQDSAAVSNDKQAIEASLERRSANVADGGIYKDLYPPSQKRQPGTLPADLQRLTSLGFHEFLVFKLMTEAKAQGKFLSDVVDASWAGLKKAHAPINYLRALLRKPVDFAHRARVLRQGAEQQVHHDADQAELTATIARCAGRTFYNTNSTRRLTVSTDGSTLMAFDAAEQQSRSAISGWTKAFAAGLREGRLLPATDQRDAAFAAHCLSVVPTLTRHQGEGRPRELTGSINGHLKEIKERLRAAGAGKFGSVPSGRGTA